MRPSCTGVWAWRTRRGSCGRRGWSSTVTRSSTPTLCSGTRSTVSVRKGVALLGGLFVFDVTGLSLSGGLANYRAVKALVEDPVYPAGEHPLPEGMRKCLICNAPWWIGRVWDVVKLLLPAHGSKGLALPCGPTRGVHGGDAQACRHRPGARLAWERRQAGLTS